MKGSKVSEENKAFNRIIYVLSQLRVYADQGIHSHEFQKYGSEKGVKSL